jgi:hypothetical protein
MTAARSPTRDRRADDRGWSRQGNDRLTASVGLILLVLLALEALTTLSLRSYLPLHLFVGILLLPPVALKLASTGWRAARYYAGSRRYRDVGPPKLPLRLLAPLLVASTLALFGSGVGLVVIGHSGDRLGTVHVVSFVIWAGLIVVHAAVHLGRAVRLGTSDWLRHAEQNVPGARIRRAVLAGAVLAGLLITLATYPAQQAFHAGAHELRVGAAARLPVARRSTASRRWQIGGPSRLRPERRILVPESTVPAAGGLWDRPALGRSPSGASRTRNASSPARSNSSSLVSRRTSSSRTKSDATAAVVVVLRQQAEAAHHHSHRDGLAGEAVGDRVVAGQETPTPLCCSWRSSA